MFVTQLLRATRKRWEKKLEQGEIKVNWAIVDVLTVTPNRALISI